MIAFRREHPVLVYGSFKLLAREDPRLFAFLREGEGERLLVELNMSSEATGGIAHRGGATVLISNSGPATETLEPWEARISALHEEFSPV
jgi:oligo-1,6-glucosidase